MGIRLYQKVRDFPLFETSKSPFGRLGRTGNLSLQVYLRTLQHPVGQSRHYKVKGMFRQIAILLAFVTVAASYGQGFNKRYNMNLPSAYGTAIVKKSNNYHTVSLVSDSIPNYRACILFNSFDDTGKVLSSKLFRISGAYTVEPGKNLIHTRDNGFANAGYTYRDTISKDEGLLVKFDSTGEVLWYKTFGGVKPNSAFFIFRDLLQTDDGGYILLGSIQFTNARVNDVIVKTDSMGNEQWRKEYPYQYWSLFASGISKSENGYIITGTDNNYLLGANEAKVYPYMTEIDTAGNVLWKWFYTINDKTAITFTGIKTDDGGYILSGYKIVGQQSGGGERKTIPYVMKIDSNKGIVWQTSTGEFSGGDPTWEYINKTIIDNDGNLIVAGTTQFHNVEVGSFYNYGLLARLSGNGDSIWARPYNISRDTLIWQSNWNEFNGIIANTDGGYTMVGEARDNFNGGAGQQLWLVRVDSNGCVQENYCSGSKPVGVAPLSFGEGSGVRFYPNPTTSTITIEIDNKMADTYLLYDLAGRVVLSGAISTNTQTVDISSISSGLYLLQIIRQGSVVGNGRVVKE